MFDRGRNVPCRQKRRATDKAQENHDQNGLRYFFHPRFSGVLKWVGVIGDLTTADIVYAKFRLWQFFGSSWARSLSARASAFNDPASGSKGRWLPLAASTPALGPVIPLFSHYGRTITTLRQIHRSVRSHGGRDQFFVPPTNLSLRPGLFALIFPRLECWQLEKLAINGKIILDRGKPL